MNAELQTEVQIDMTPIAGDHPQLPVPGTAEATQAQAPLIPPAMPRIEQVKARVTYLEALRDQKVQNADAQAKSEIDAIREKHKTEQLTEVTAVKGRQKVEKTAARDNCKNAIGTWTRVLKGLEAEQKALDATEAAAAAVLAADETAETAPKPTDGIRSDGEKAPTAAELAS